MDLGKYLDGFDERDWERPVDGIVRFAVVGLGGFARYRALPAIADAEGCAATVAVSGSPEKADAVADEHDLRAISYEAFHDGAAADAYDAVYVATPNTRHREPAETAAGLGKHVLCEKPLAGTPENAAAMVEACDDAGVTLMTAYRLQVDPAYRRLRELIQDGGIGEPVQLHGGFSTHVMEPDYGPDQWRLDPELAGGGALLDLGVYPLNTARFLLDADPIAVAAETASQDDAFAGVDEHVALRATFPGAVTGSFTASFDAYDAATLEVLGTRGRVRIEDAYGSATDRDVVVERRGTEASLDPPSTDEVVEEFAYFANCVLDGRPPEPDGEGGLTDLRAAAAAYESAERGERVDL